MCDGGLGVHGGGHAWQGACMAVVGGHAWWGGGMCVRGGEGAWQGVCVVEVCMVAGGVLGRRYGHCSGWYASYWNAFLFQGCCVNCCYFNVSASLKPK